MNMTPEGQLTTEGKLLCGAIIIAGLFEEGRVQVSSPDDEEAAQVLRQVLSAMYDLKEEAKDWPEATQ